MRKESVKLSASYYLFKISQFTQTYQYQISGKWKNHMKIVNDKVELEFNRAGENPALCSF